jgi:hypothetical protein
MDELNKNIRQGVLMVEILSWRCVTDMHGPDDAESMRGLSRAAAKDKIISIVKAEIKNANCQMSRSYMEAAIACLAARDRDSDLAKAQEEGEASLQNVFGESVVKKLAKSLTK